MRSSNLIHHHSHTHAIRFTRTQQRDQEIRLQQHRPFSSLHSPLSTSTTQLRMQTKSGGRAILTEEQFETEVVNVKNNTSSNTKNKDKTNTKTNTKPILVFYSAPWCGPCRLSNPVVKEIIKQFVPRIDVVEVCTDDLPDIAENAGVVSIPTIQLYYEGELLETIVGCVAKNVLSSAVTKILEDLGLDDGDDCDDNDLD
jgi:thioredoxin 1